MSKDDKERSKFLESTKKNKLSELFKPENTLSQEKTKLIESTLENNDDSSLTWLNGHFSKAK